MFINVRTEHGTHVVGLTGDMVGDQSEFLATLSDLMSQRGARVVLDLSGVAFLNSAAISDLVHVVAQGNVQECRIVLAALTPFVTGVLQTTRLDRFFEVYDSVADALDKLR
ncbi:MAG: STAS domain-containing protein [Phycisphaerales bacterium]|nr:STAS domain-containing protein [Phycisphaerales bacterium]